MNAKPLVSFIISAYNSEDFIEKCIRSIFNQTYKNIEIVVIDDCSTDSTNLILNNLSKVSKVKMIIIRNKINLGLTKSLNIAATNANGEWLARQDADDLSKKDRIESQINFATKNVHYSIIGSSCSFINKSGKYLFSKNYPSSHEQIKSALERAGAFFPHSSVIIKKNVFWQLGGYNEYMKYSQDFELWLRASSEYKIFSINRPLVSIRIHSNRISNHNRGNNQLIYSRACLIAHWLSNDLFVNHSYIYSKENWSIFLNAVSNFLGKHPYYLGRESYIKFIKEFRINKSLLNFKYLLLNIQNITFYIIIFLVRQELFLRKKSQLFKEIFP